VSSSTHVKRPLPGAFDVCIATGAIGPCAGIISSEWLPILGWDNHMLMTDAVL
jgi:hypothetical protein